ncbi:MAG: hypothetical protein J6M10_10345 [Clostridia bacterium]|nr:hypothetical protein [Clostridia bacterium]
MPRRNYSKHPSRQAFEDCFDRDYVNLPEYPQYNTVTVLPMKTIFVNLDADPHADDFYVVKHYGDRVFKKLAKRINMMEVIA